MLFKVALVFLACLLFLGCTEVQIVQCHVSVEPLVPVELTPRILGVSTRAANTEWQAGDRLGVYMLKKGTALEEENIINDAHNRCYRVTEGGESTRLVAEEVAHEMNYPGDGSSVDFVAYYPYRPSMNKTFPVRVDNQQQFPAIDLLHGRATGNKQSGNVEIYMTHRLSKIRILLRTSPELSGLENAEIRAWLVGMPIASGYCLSTQAFDYLNENGEQEMGSILTQPILQGAIYEAIVLPQPVGRFSGRRIALVSSTQPEESAFAYNFLISDGEEFLSGKQYIYTLTLREEGVVDGSLTILDWLDDDVDAYAVEMISIRGGDYLMGSSDERYEDETLREVRVEDFMMSRNEITNAQYASFLNSIRLSGDGIREGEVYINSSFTRLMCRTDESTGTAVSRWYTTPGLEEHPVTGVSWYGARAFAEWQGGSLPTEEQWEYACRGGATSTNGVGTAYGFGNDGSLLHQYAWYEENNNTVNGDGIGTKTIGTRLMNGFTLYDMHGNVWEWCRSEYEQTGRRVLRGGAFDSPMEDCRSARRHSARPEEMGGNIGFRITMDR